jgi:urease accessory protein
MNPFKHPRTLALAALCLYAGTASAHTGVHTGSGFAGGLAHPFVGLDHLLAMLAIGVWAAHQGGRALWAVPAAFVGAMLLGGAFGLAGWMLPQVETVIALSVLVLGLLISYRRQWPLAIGMAIAAAFAVFHGFAHAAEMPQGSMPLLYAAGFVIATAFLHGVGIVSGRLGRQWLRVAGMAIAATGFALILGG